MKFYDMNKVIRTIQMKSDILDSASLGMGEDWFWTAETIYADGRFKVELRPGMLFGGIKGSSWATPTLQLLHKDGTEEYVDCYTDDGAAYNRPVDMDVMNGPLSGPVQEKINKALDAKWEAAQAPKKKSGRKMKIS